MTSAGTLDDLLDQVRACTHCAAHLTHGPRPVLRAHGDARVMIIGQAPGIRVHRTGIPWNDPSGDRLRHWLELDRDAFYDQRNIAIVPIGFCFPGYDKTGSDAPPRRECAPLWHPGLLDMLPNIEFTLLIGGYAQAYYLGKQRQKNLTETVKNWRDYYPEYLPLPHPSWRNTGWLKKNPWFDEQVLPVLRETVHGLIG